jgi:hypothetical protein
LISVFVRFLSLPAQAWKNKVVWYNQEIKNKKLDGATNLFVSGIGSSGFRYYTGPSAKNEFFSVKTWEQPIRIIDTIFGKLDTINLVSLYAVCWYSCATNIDSKRKIGVGKKTT